MDITVFFKERFIRIPNSTPIVNKYVRGDERGNGLGMIQFEWYTVERKWIRRGYTTSVRKIQYALKFLCTKKLGQYHCFQEVIHLYFQTNMRTTTFL